MRILVVEDDLNNREVVSRFLARAGFEVIHAADGKEGVEAAETQLPDLVLMDLNLPQVDGWEATRRIRQNPKTAGIPVIALTAHATEDDVAKAMLAGCNHFETKPVLYPRLIRKVRAMLNGGN